MLRRETLIALRARHTAFRIALDILHPPQTPPQRSPEPAVRFAEVVEQVSPGAVRIIELPEDVKRLIRASERRHRIYLWFRPATPWLIGVAVGIAFMLMVIALVRLNSNTDVYVSPPYGRPISNP